MRFKKTSINDLIIINPTLYKDSRGYFYESYVKKKLNSEILQNFNFTQENISFSKKNTLRGLHFQNYPYMQNKLLKVLDGSILDVCVDIRKKSETYLKIFKIKLHAQNNISLFIPKGVAHGFLVLSEYAKVSYFVDKPYAPKKQNGIIFDDNYLNIKWGIPKKKIILSSKDKKLKTLKQLKLI